MTVTTELRLRSASLPLVELTASLQPDEVECVHALCLQSDVRIFTVRIDSTDDVSDDDLAALEEVVEVTALGRTNGKRMYQLTVELADAISEAFDPDRFDGAQLEPTTITPEGWYEKKVFKDYETFAEFRTSCEEHGIPIELVSITADASSTADSSRHGLTDRQHEALTLAIARGYYDSPRRTSMEALAEELGISQPALSTLLRRAERQVLTSALDARKHVETVSS
ncbi:helix-turn-helix domain-containing protein [Natrinema pallidum]|uniref:helix-turn-helix domain-containing protein n=1 Tax=Natrinema pallidum TaxID=69527 RepID=UPI0015868294|nr:helix-turn-helix domain-containing protein [Natrinema pallidum]